MNTRRTYHGDRRREQMDRTRERILDGLVRTMARGIATLSIPAVAQEAGVSVPTVYRYFRTKGELLEALGPYVGRKLGVSADRPPSSLEELAGMVRELYLRAEGLDETLRVAMVSELGDRLRRMANPSRVKLIEGALDPISDRLSERDRTRLRNVILVLTSSAVMRAFKDYLDLSGKDAADDVTWAICALARAAIAESDGNEGA